MTPSFHRAFDHLMRYESTSFSDKASDRGGRTKYGITEREYQKDFPGFNIEELTIIQARTWYWQRYWLPLKLDRVNPPFIAAELFEQAVNMPWGQAVKHAQRALGLLRAHVAVDGIMGLETITAINSCVYPEVLLKLMNGFQVWWYIDLAERHPDQKVNVRGWLRRVEL